jgi:hypothetical protein
MRIFNRNLRAKGILYIISGAVGFVNKKVIKNETWAA